MVETPKPVPLDDEALATTTGGTGNGPAAPDAEPPVWGYSDDTEAGDDGADVEPATVEGRIASFS